MSNKRKFHLNILISSLLTLISTIISLPEANAGADMSDGANAVCITDLSITPAANLQPGIPVTIRVEASNGAGLPLYYKFFYCAGYGTALYETSPWTVVQDYTTSNSAQYLFPSSGSYVVVVRVVTDPANEPADFSIIGQAVTVGDAGQVDIGDLSLSATPDTKAGDTVTITAAASTTAEREVYYRFYYCANYGLETYNTTPWTMVQDYATTNSCQITFPAPGNYIVVARAVTDPSQEPAALPLTGAVVRVKDAQVVNDENDINALLKSLEELYATTPSSSDITAWFSNVSEDYMDDGGRDKSGELNNWLEFETGPVVGAKLAAIIVKPLSIDGYVRAYQIRISHSYNGNTDYSMMNMVYDGAKWLLYGNQAWLVFDLISHAFMWATPYAPNEFSTGFGSHIEDEYHYAYDKGVRSAVLRGPGLPEGGIVYEHRVSQFTLYGNGGSFYSISSSSSLDDTTIAGIPTNATYTLCLCTQSPNVVSADPSACDRIQTYTTTVAKPPLPVSSLDASMFATLTHPATHLISDFDFGGVINVSWNKPDGTTSGEVGLYLSPQGSWVSSDPDADDISTSIDTTGFSIPSSASLFIRVTDGWERDFNMGWEIH
ncbi:MAG: hypothetical protein V2B19_32895 [Pseudomonadota bacterium]